MLSKSELTIRKERFYWEHTAKIFGKTNKIDLSFLRLPGQYTLPLREGTDALHLKIVFFSKNKKTFILHSLFHYAIALLFLHISKLIFNLKPG